MLTIYGIPQASEIILGGVKINPAYGAMIDASGNLIITGGTARYLGQWDAMNNVPTLPNPPTAPTYQVNDYRVVTVPGTQFGISFLLGQEIVVVPNGSAFAWAAKDPTTGVVTSFNGRTGPAIIPVSTDYTPEFIGAIKAVGGMGSNNSLDGLTISNFTDFVKVLDNTISSVSNSLVLYASVDSGGFKFKAPDNNYYQVIVDNGIQTIRNKLFENAGITDQLNLAAILASSVATPATGTINLFCDSVTGLLNFKNHSNVSVAFADVSTAQTFTDKTLTSPSITTPTVSSGNLIFGTVGQRITGDTVNATVANRLAFTDSAANANTSLSILPTGTATQSSIVAYADATGTSNNFVQLLSTTSANYLISGSSKQFVFQSGGSLIFRMLTSGILLNNGARLSSEITAGNVAYLSAYNTGSSAYANFIAMTSGATPSMVFSQPAGGLLQWNGGSIVSPAISTPSITSPNITGGNITASSLSQRFVADFSAATRSQRFLFQNSNSNASTLVGGIPNGIGDGAGFVGYSAVDPDNSAFLSARAASSTGYNLINTGKNGSGTAQPLVFQYDAAEIFRYNSAKISLAAGKSIEQADGGLLINSNAPATPATGFANIYYDATTKWLNYLPDSGSAQVILNGNSYQVAGYKIALGQIDFLLNNTSSGTNSIAQTYTGNKGASGDFTRTLPTITGEQADLAGGIVGMVQKFTVTDAPWGLTIQAGGGNTIVDNNGKVTTTLYSSNRGDTITLRAAAYNVVAAGCVWHIESARGDWTATNTWTATDGSGASLSLTTNYSIVRRSDRSIFLNATITYPITVSGSNAKINGLPFNAASGQTALLNCTCPTLTATGLQATIVNGDLSIENIVTKALLTNVQLSGAAITISGTYSY